MIDFYSDSTEVLLNQAFTNEQKNEITNSLLSFNLKGHVWFATSGSTLSSNEKGKWVALSKEAIIKSANAVNIHLDATSSDIWLNPLPLFHVGGVGIIVRSLLSKSKCFHYEQKWNPNKFYQKLVEHKVTLTSLVPTQLYDLVSLNIKAPEHLRAIIIGGGALHQDLYEKARHLGWNVLPSYGLTESGSQVATASLESLTKQCYPSLQILTHINVLINLYDYICLKGDSLLTSYAKYEDDKLTLFDPKLNGWFKTEDKGKLQEQSLKIYGRANSFVKIGGESVEMARLEALLEKIKLEAKANCDLALVPVPDERLGHVIHLVSNTGLDSINSIVNNYQTCVLPFERIRDVHILKEIPRTALNKLRREEVLQQIKSRSDLATQK